MGLGWRQRLHQGRTELASLDEIVTLALIVISSGCLLCFVNAAVADPWMPRSVPLMASFVALAIMGAARAAWRLAEESARRLRPNDKAVRVLILGAGDGGRQLIRSMRRAAEKGWTKRATDISWDPVGLLDDDLHKRHLRIYGVAVMGTSVDIRAIAERTDASVLVVAIPSADATFIRAVSEVGDGGGACGQGGAQRRPAARRTGRRAVGPRHQRRGPVGPPAGGDRRGVHRPLHRRPSCSGHRRRGIDRLRALPTAVQVRACRADHARPRRVGTARGTAVDPRPGPARLHRSGAGRHPRRGVRRRLLPHQEAAGRLPRGRPQAPPAPGAVPGRGGQDERLGHA